MENLILGHGLWVVVADGEKALFLRNEGDAKFPDFQVVQEMEQANPATASRASSGLAATATVPPPTTAPMPKPTGTASARNDLPTTSPSGSTSSPTGGRSGTL